MRLANFEVCEPGVVVLDISGIAGDILDFAGAALRRDIGVARALNRFWCRDR
jgi:hypothetical protein